MGTAYLAYSNLDSYSHENILAYVDNRSNVRDPRGQGTLKDRQFVYDTDPLMKSLSYSGMPYIVVEFPAIEDSQPTADGKHKRVDFKSKIIVRAARDGASNSRTGQGRTDMLQISDDLFKLFNSMTKKKELALLGINEITLKKIAVDTLTIMEKECYEWIYDLNYWCRMVTSL